MLKTFIKNELNYDLTHHQMDQFNDYYNLLVSYNEHTNLTRITSLEDVNIKHFLDSVLLTKLIDFNSVSTLVDMGAGAGFPSIPILILYPNLRVTIVESQIKRITFLQELTKTLKLNVNIVHERVEVYALKHQKEFDVVTARALGELNIILEYGIPMLKERGYFIAPKGSKYQEEVDAAKHALKKLKSEVVKVDSLELPNEQGLRTNLLIQKQTHVSGFPRAYQQMIKKPL